MESLIKEEKEKGGEEMSELKFEAFPYKPYSIQLDFMSALYRSLDRGGVSMLESPTGTGKTLSIICSTLQWVTDRRRKEALIKAKPQEDKNGIEYSDNDEPDWMRDFVLKKDIDRTPDRHTGNNKYNDYKKDFSSIDLEKVECGGSVKSGDDNEENEFLLEEYESEEEGSGGGKSKRKACGRGLCSSSTDDEDENGGCDEEVEKEFKVYFCSRTHSQLSQFVKELRKTVFDREIKVVCLASRKNFCINEDMKLILVM